MFLQEALQDTPFIKIIQNVLVRRTPVLLRNYLLCRPELMVGNPVTERGFSIAVEKFIGSWNNTDEVNGSCFGEAVDANLSQGRDMPLGKEAPVVCR